MLEPRAELNEVVETLLEPYDVPRSAITRERARKLVATSVRATLQLYNITPDTHLRLILLDLDKGYRGIKPPLERIAI